MTSEEEGALRHVRAIQGLNDEQILIAYNNGYRDPNLDPYNPVVKFVLESRLLTKISDNTKELARINEESKVEAKRLVESSLTIEHLTRWLVGLTVTLIVLTLVLAVDVGYKFTKEHIAVPPPRTAPQTPVPRPH